MTDFKKVFIHRNSNIKPVNLRLVSSKSESNRALIISALAETEGRLENLSEARDTQTMKRLLNTQEQTWDVLDAGTTMRFLTAFAAVKGYNKVLTGTPRMQERPIKILVDALRELGVEIEYHHKDGYPPHEIKGFVSQKKRQIQIRGDVSSQYISALCMISPMLPQGIELELTGKISSRPYIEMTLALMKKFGADVHFNENIITVEPKKYSTGTYTIESDWSGASYWFSVVALAEKAELKLMGLREDSLQGDIATVRIMDQLGVKAVFDKEGAVLTKKMVHFNGRLDFSQCPDLAQTICVTLAAKGLASDMVGLESLRIKETDRIAALQIELAKMGARLEEISNSEWKLIPPTKQFSQMENLSIHTYEDHRMAMAFAPLATISDLTIDDPAVVNKSYPSYWKDFEKAGFKLEFES